MNRKTAFAAVGFGFALAMLATSSASYAACAKGKSYRQASVSAPTKDEARTARAPALVQQQVAPEASGGTAPSGA